MKRRGPWLVLLTAVVVLVGIMAGVTVRLWSLEEERLLAEQRSAHEEQVRLALWRLDTQIAPLLSQEIAAVAALVQAPDAADRIPRPDTVKARFVLPDEGLLEILVVDNAATDDKLGGLLSSVDLWAMAPPATGPTSILDNPSTYSVEKIKRGIGSISGGSKRGYGSGSLGGFFSPVEQKRRSVAELSNRVEAVEGNMAAYQSSLATNSAATDERNGAPALLPGGPARPTWVDDELMVVRQVDDGGMRQLHGSWLDWSALRTTLERRIDDLLPHATLVPTPNDPGDDVQHLLATLPVRLDPGSPAAVELDAWAALGPSLLLGWLGTLAAVLAVVFVLRWSLALSERRAAFVSAVTHELRTPLTTFRMYSEMLEEGMVDEAKRGRYVSTLRREADRLGALVENVLAYSRIESDRTPLTPERISVDDLLGRMQERLGERARAANLELRVSVPDDLGADLVRVDPTAAEQILFNLVDNAAKYAPSRDTPRVDLSVAEASRGRLALRVRDHGPGIDPAEHRAIFEPFSKARAHASGTKPGVGLGLALCRRLARQLGGDLRVESADPGARFVLLLPRV